MASVTFINNLRLYDTTSIVINYSRFAFIAK